LSIDLSDFLHQKLQLVYAAPLCHAKQISGSAKLQIPTLAKDSKPVACK